MAYWKSTFGNLSAYFNCESQEDLSTGNNMGNPSTNQSERIEPSPTVDVKEELNTMVHDVWEEMLGRVLNSHPMILEHLFSVAGSDTESNVEVKVVKEVFKREMIIALEHIYVSRLKPNGKERNAEASKEVHGSVDSFKRSLKDMTEKVAEVEGALRIAMKEKCELQFTCDEYKEELHKVAEVLQAVNEENKALREKNASLVNSVKLLNIEVKELREAKGAEEMNALRSQHDAEMAHLIAKQSALQAKLLDKQLREANSSSKVMENRVEELRRVQKEMRNVFVNSSGRSESNIMGAQYSLLMHRGSKPLGQLATALTRRKQKHDVSEANGRTKIEKNRSQAVQADDEGSSSSPTGRQFRNGESGNRNPGGAQQRVRRRFTRGWLTGSNREPRVPERRNERERILNRFLELGRGTSRNDNREAEVGRDSRGRAAWLGELKRILFPSTYNEALNDRRSVGTAPQTLEALGENLEALRDVAENKQREVDRLRGELRAATLRSDALERRLRKEQHKRVERKFGCSAYNGASGLHGTDEVGRRNCEEGEEISPC